MIRRTIAAAGAALLAVATPTSATAGPSPTSTLLPTAQARLAAAAAPWCYHPTNRITVATADEVGDDTYGVVYESAAQWVAASPCRDVNVRRPRNASGPAAGQPVCALIQVSFGPAESGPWVEVCGSWRVPYAGAVEGRPFVVRSAFRPVTVTVAS